jgi:putative inorganic carbon (HCO3(-)) transporter
MTRFAPFNEGYQAVSNDDVMVDFAHNDFLNIGVCTGLVGLVLYVAFVIALLVRCLRMVNRCPVLVILVAGILGYLAYSFFVFSIAIVSPLFWVMAGLADKCVRQASEGAWIQEGSSGTEQ